MNARTESLKPNKGDRLASLDVARSIAAITVVLWHWQHFQYSGYSLRPDFDRTAQPLYLLLFPFYEGGWLAVDFFFILSGYVFFWKYRTSVRDGSVGSWTFFILRFSRLYPLHFLTLILVAALQAIYFHIHGVFFVFQFNDLYHFVLQLFFASQWGLQHGASFNDPVWSLSVEVLLYAMFFVVAKYSSSRWPLLAILSLLGFVLYASNVTNAIGRGMFCFFVGGMLAQLLHALRDNRRRDMIEITAYGLLLLVVVLALLAWRYDVTRTLSDTIGAWVGQWFPGLASLQVAVSGRLLRVINYLLMAALLFPALIVSLVLAERRFHSQFERLSFIGDISYASYLLHIPLQIACVLLLPSVFSNSQAPAGGISMLSFLALLIGASFTSFHYFERPAQNIIRRRALGRSRSRISNVPGPVKTVLYIRKSNS